MLGGPQLCEREFLVMEKFFRAVPRDYWQADQARVDS